MLLTFGWQRPRQNRPTYKHCKRQVHEGHCMMYAERQGWKRWVNIVRLFHSWMFTSNFLFIHLLDDDGTVVSQWLMVCVILIVQVADRARLNHLREMQLHTLASGLEKVQRSQLASETGGGGTVDWLLSATDSTEPGKERDEEARERERRDRDPSSTWSSLPQDSPGLSGMVLSTLSQLNYLSLSLSNVTNG